MPTPSKPYILSWEKKAKDVAEINARLASQLSKTNEILDTLFVATNNLSTRLTSLEARVTELE